MLVRLIFFALLFYIGYRLLKSWGGSFKRGDRVPGANDGLQNTELIQDPQCKTYFLKGHGVGSTINGETIYFCSEDCRNAYLEKHRTTS